MTSARLQVGFPCSPLVSSIHMQQIDWKVLPSPMESDCAEREGARVGRSRVSRGGAGGGAARSWWRWCMRERPRSTLSSCAHLDAPGEVGVLQASQALEHELQGAGCAQATRSCERAGVGGAPGRRCGRGSAAQGNVAARAAQLHVATPALPKRTCTPST